MKKCEGLVWEEASLQGSGEYRDGETRRNQRKIAKESASPWYFNCSDAAPATAERSRRRAACSAMADTRRAPAAASVLFQHPPQFIRCCRMFGTRSIPIHEIHCASTLQASWKDHLRTRRSERLWARSGAVCGSVRRVNRARRSIRSRADISIPAPNLSQPVVVNISRLGHAASLCKVRLPLAGSRSIDGPAWSASAPSWLLVIVVGEISIARRYASEMTRNEAKPGAGSRCDGEVDRAVDRLADDMLTSPVDASVGISQSRQSVRQRRLRRCAHLIRNASRRRTNLINAIATAGSSTPSSAFARCCAATSASAWSPMARRRRVHAW